MSLLVIIPVNAFISVLAVRSQVRFSCGELAGALRKSTVLLVLSAAGPAITRLESGCVDANGACCDDALRRRLDLRIEAYSAPARAGCVRRERCLAQNSSCYEGAGCRGAAFPVIGGKSGPSVAEEPTIEQDIENTVIRGPNWSTAPNLTSPVRAL